MLKKKNILFKDFKQWSKKKVYFWKPCKENVYREGRKHQFCSSYSSLKTMTPPLLADTRPIPLWWLFIGNNSNPYPSFMSAHVRLECPSFSYMVVHFHTVKIGNPVITAYSIQFTTVDNQSHTTPFLVHGLDVAPCVSHRVEAFHTLQEDVAIVTSCRVDFTIKRSHTKTTSLREHRGHRCPLTAVIVVAFNLKQNMVH